MFSRFTHTCIVQWLLYAFRTQHQTRRRPPSHSSDDTSHASNLHQWLVLQSAVLLSHYSLCHLPRKVGPAQTMESWTGKTEATRVSTNHGAKRKHQRRSSTVRFQEWQQTHEARTTARPISFTLRWAVVPGKCWLCRANNTERQGWS
jgi:hypothetical protein